MNPLDALNEESKVSAEDAMLTAQENRVISFFSDATPLDWEDWIWQTRHRITTKEILGKLIKLTPQEEKGIEGCGEKLSMSIPPYFASLMDPEDSACPIRLQCVPQGCELEIFSEEMDDPCAEDKHSPVRGLVHRYPDRVLFLVNEMCAMYCRFCTRSRMVGDGNRTLSMETYDAAFEYIRAHKEIRDVLISGGDPLMLSDRVLEHIIKTVKEIPHVEFLRIGTRVPVTMPQRITSDLVNMLKKYNPLWMSIHFNHPKEITKRVQFACDSLADAGIPLGSQTVLLKGINDAPQVMKKLMHDLLKIRVRPYYIYQCDPIYGSKHFRTPVSAGIDIMEQLQGHTTGYAVPTFVIDGPGGGGKIPINPDYVVSREENRYILRNYAGGQFIYHDPV